MSVNYEGRKIMGYRRENGRVGVRNHVLILPWMIFPMQHVKLSPTTSRERSQYLMPMAASIR